MSIAFLREEGDNYMVWQYTGSELMIASGNRANAGQAPKTESSQSGSQLFHCYSGLMKVMGPHF